MPRLRQTPTERFWAKVDQTGPLLRPDLGPCWPFLTNGVPQGRGLLRINGVYVTAARFSWELAYGRIPGSLQVLHECDYPPCIRPSHLFLGTAAQNQTDKQLKNRALRVLSTEQRAELQQLYGEGQLTYRALAEHFGISQTSAYYIAHDLRSARQRLAANAARRKGGAK